MMEPKSSPDARPMEDDDDGVESSCRETACSSVPLIQRYADESSLQITTRTGGQG